MFTRLAVSRIGGFPDWRFTGLAVYQIGHLLDTGVRQSVKRGVLGAKPPRFGARKGLLLRLQLSLKICRRRYLAEPFPLTEVYSGTISKAHSKVLGNYTLFATEWETSQAHPYFPFVLRFRS